MKKFKLFNPLIRFFRYLKYRCVVCNRPLESKSYNSGMRYCSISCICYDKYKVEYISKHPIKTLFFGHVDNYKKHFKYEKY